MSVARRFVGDRLGDAAQHDVAGRVAVRVVDGLEVVDVDEGDATAAARSGSARSTSVKSAARRACRLATPVSWSIVARSWVSASDAEIRLIARREAGFEAAAALGHTSTV